MVRESSGQNHVRPLVLSEDRPEFNALKDNAQKLGIPVFATWETTYRCPVRCRHCYLGHDAAEDCQGVVGEGRQEEGELDLAEAKQLLQQMARLGVLFLTFTGGEPMLRDDFFEIVDEARALRFSWRLYTSAMLIDEARARLIAERAPLAVDISLHGLEETHDWMTGVQGSFQKATAAIGMLAKLGVSVNAKMNMTPRGMKDLPALRQLCERIGAKQRAWTSMYPDREGRPVADELILSEDQLRECYANLEQLLPGCYGRARSLGSGDALCGAGRSSFAVSPRGDVRACMGLGESCGNVRETPLGDIWNSPSMTAYRKITAGDRPGCRDCEDAEFCFFCMQLAEKETGDPLGAPPTACREARVRRELFGSSARA